MEMVVEIHVGVKGVYECELMHLEISENTLSWDIWNKKINKKSNRCNLQVTSDMSACICRMMINMKIKFFIAHLHVLCTGTLNI